MNRKSFWIACLSGAALTTLFSNIPYMGLLNCLLCAWFWGGAIFSVWLYKRQSGSVNSSLGLRIGAITGLIAGILGFLLGFVGLAGVDALMNSASAFMSSSDLQQANEIPAWAGWIVNLIGVIFNIGFGALGGWIGGTLLKPKAVPQQAGEAV